MRTFLSHDATAKCSLAGENRISEILSSGGRLSGTSLEMSPVVLVWLADDAAEPTLPKRDIGEKRERARELALFLARSSKGKVEKGESENSGRLEIKGAHAEEREESERGRGGGLERADKRVTMLWIRIDLGCAMRASGRKKKTIFTAFRKSELYTKYSMIVL